MYQGEPCIQPARRARRDQRDRARRLHRSGAGIGEGVLRGVARHSDGRLQAEVRLMADLLLEVFCEEIPARMQAQAAKDLERLVVGALSDRGLMFEGARAFAGPRRLTLA